MNIITLEETLQERHNTVGEVSQNIINMLNLKSVTKDEAEKQYCRWNLSKILFKSPYKNLNKQVSYQLIREGMLYCSRKGISLLKRPDKIIYKFTSMLQGVQDNSFPEEGMWLGYMRDKMSEDCTWYDYLKHAAHLAAIDTTETLSLSPWLLNVIEKNENVTFMVFVIPNFESNIQFIEKLMSFYGYFISSMSQCDVLGKDYVILEFIPEHQPVINEKLAEYQSIYHLSPSSKDEKISKNGLVPKDNTNILYKYPPRIYLLNTDNFGNEIPDTQKLNFVRFARKLSREREKYPEEYVNNSNYTLWKIDLKELLNIINIQIDYTEEDFPSFYVTENIRPELLYKVCEIVVD